MKEREVEESRRGRKGGEWRDRGVSGVKGEVWGRGVRGKGWLGRREGEWWRGRRGGGEKNGVGAGEK